MAIKFKLHPLFIFFGLLLFYYGFGLVFSVYLFCVILHELGHYFMAKNLGYKLNIVSLFPFGASLSGEKTVFTEKDEVLIAIAGPAVNVLLIMLTICGWWIFPESYYYTEIFFVSNLAILFFNLLPVFPLDGGRVLMAVMSLFMQRKNAVKISRIVGFLVSLIFTVLFVVSAFSVVNYTFAIVSVFLILAVFDDNSKCKYYSSIENFSGKKFCNDVVNVKTIAVSENIKIIKVFTKLSCNKLNLVYVLNSKRKIIAKLTGRQIVEFMECNSLQCKLKDILK